MAKDEIQELLEMFQDGSGFGNPDARRNAEQRLNVHKIIMFASMLVAFPAYAAPSSVVCSDAKFQFTLTSLDVFDTDGTLKPTLKPKDRIRGVVDVINRETGEKESTPSIGMVIGMVKDNLVVFDVFGPVEDYKKTGNIQLQVLIEATARTGWYGINRPPLITPNKLTCAPGANSAGRMPNPENPSEFVTTQQILVDAALKNVADMQKQIPLKVDEHATLISASFSSMIMTRAYRIDMKASDVDFQAVKQLVISNSCKAENMKFVIQFGLENKYMYFDKDGVFVGTFTVDKAACR